MSNTLDDRSGLTQAFNALWELATPEQREHFKQDEITPKRLSEAIREARIDELEAIRHKDEVDTNKFRPSNNPLSQSITDRLKQLKEKL